MALAHQAVSFPFSVTHEGLSYDQEVFNLVWESGIRSWKKRLGRLHVSSNLSNQGIGDIIFLMRLFSFLNNRIAYGMEHIQPTCKAYG